MKIKSSEDSSKEVKFNIKPRILILVLTMLTIHMFTYYGTRLVTRGMRHINMTSSVDCLIPFEPWTIVIYLGCYLFWAINYALGCLQNEDDAVNFMTAECIAKVVCCMCFLFIPTTNIRPVVTGSGIFSEAMRWLYSVDAPDNLFPSIHCLSSWFCVIAVREQKKIPMWYKGLSVVLASLVFISTLTTKQHVIADVIAGVMIAEISYRFAVRIHRKNEYSVVLEQR